VLCVTGIGPRRKNVARRKCFCNIGAYGGASNGSDTYCNIGAFGGARATVASEEPELGELQKLAPPAPPWFVRGRGRSSREQL
jgi:hypothetical protein